MFSQGQFLNDANATPETIARKRALIAALMPKFGKASYVGEGLGQLATGYMVGRQNKKLDASEAAGRKSAEEMFNALIGGGGSGGYTAATSGGGGSPSGTWTPAAPAPKATESFMGMPDVAKGGLSFGLPQTDTGVAGTPGGLDFGSATMTPQEMLIEGAKARGLDPVDVATAISYETGGKFDPTIKGPTTQWGTHEGLIQFGDPQGEKYGVDFSSPEAAWRTQLDPTSGGVWGYLEDTGVKPGMGLPEIYSAINAGAVGRMGASDANNGGAPGTVADKVAGMGPHREKAAAFLGGTWTPDPNATVTASAKNDPAFGGSMGSEIPMQDLLAAMANPWLAPEQRAVLSSIYEQQTQAADPLRQLELKKAELELAQLENPTDAAPEDFTARMFTLNSLGIDPQSEEGKVYLMTGDLPEDSTNNVPAGFATLDMQAQAAGYQPGTPEYQEFMKNGGTSGAPAAFIALDLQAKAAGFTPGTPEYQDFMATRGAGLAEGAKVRAGAAAEAEVAAPADIVVADRTLGYIDEVRNHPGKGQGTGLSSYGNWIPGTSGKDFQNRVDQLKSGAFLSAIDEMRGMGSLSNAEGQTATAAITRMDTATSEEEFNAALDDYEKIVRLGRDRAQKKLKAPADAPTGGPVSITSDAEYDALPSGTTFVGPDGKTRRKP